MQAHQSVWVMLLALTTVVTLTAAAAPTSGGIPTCATKMAQCYGALNDTKTPPTSQCCDPLKEVITKERDCICGIYNNPALLQAVNINLTNALALPKRCKIDIGSTDPTALCKGTASSPPSTGASTTPPAGSGSGSESGSATTAGGKKNAAEKIKGTGLVAGLLLFSAYLMFY